jgi:endonuclease-8
MEGPSIFLAAEQLSSFINHKIKDVSGNTKIGKERLLGQKVLDIFSFGKYLFFQFETFALRTHFLLYGSFEATVKNKKVTGDYARKKRDPRLALRFSNGHIEMYSCSVRYVEASHAKDFCDFSTDIMSPMWDKKKAYQTLKNYSDQQIADVLLDQAVFTGVGNIIKNEVLLRAQILPTRLVKTIYAKDLKNIIKLTRDFVFKFYEWRKNFELKKNYLIYRQSVCKLCGSKVTRKKTGVRKRISFMCHNCEK